MFYQRLFVEEHDEKKAVQAIFKNQLGFDITESCRSLRSLLLLSNCIGIMTEDKNTILSLLYNYKELIDS